MNDDTWTVKVTIHAKEDGCRDGWVHLTLPVGTCGFKLNLPLNLTPSSAVVAVAFEMQQWMEQGWAQPTLPEPGPANVEE
jgi:hypothetical protein